MTNRTLAIALTVATGLTAAVTTTGTAQATGTGAARVGLSVSTTSLRFGSRVTLSAAVTPASATGSVVFSEIATTGPARGTRVVLGTGFLAGGVAKLKAAIPDFGPHTIVATYRGSTTNRSAVSPARSVEVTGYSGEVIVREFRSSGAGGRTDSYVELFNTGKPVPLAGFVVRTSATDRIVLPVTAGTLGTGRSYLLTGPSYSLANVAAPDDRGVLTAAGFSGVQVQAPDTAGTRTDAAGNAHGYSEGAALATVTGTPAGQWAWVRLENAGIPVDTGNNAADFRLVSTTAAVIGGVQSMLGSPSPLSTTWGYQVNSLLTSGLLDPTVSIDARPNFAYEPASKLLTVRRLITNHSTVNITRAKVRITALSETRGAPMPGVDTQPSHPAALRVRNPATTTSRFVVGGKTVVVHNLAVAAPATAVAGGGLNTTLAVPLPGGLAPGRSVAVSFTFHVTSVGVWWFVYDIDAKSGTPVAAQAAGIASGSSVSGPHDDGSPSAAGGRGVLE